MIIVAQSAQKQQWVDMPIQYLPSFELRDYQIALVDRVIAEFKAGHKNVLMQSATGSGKTKTAATIINQPFQQGSRILALAHRHELVSQIQQELSILFGCPVGVIKSGVKETPSAQIQVASVQSLCRRDLSKYQFDFIWTDEAHHAISVSYKRIYEAYPEALHLGVTATPLRLDGKGLLGVFSSLVCGPQVRELIERGSLADYDYFIGARIKTDGVHKLGGDFNAKQLAECAADIKGKIAPEWLKHANGKATVAFCVDIEHVRAVLEEYLTHGIPAAAITSKTPLEVRESVMKAFREGEIKILVNCGIIDEGIDVPGIECVQIIRPTESLAKYLQQIGRALRPAPGKRAIILDHTDNYQKHGYPKDHREWSLADKPKGNGVSPYGECPGKGVRDTTQDTDAELVRAEEFVPWLDRCFNLLRYQRRRGYPFGWLRYALVDFMVEGMDLEILRKFCILLRQSDWVPTILESAQTQREFNELYPDL